jgi:hypothetical protein
MASGRACPDSIAPSSGVLLGKASEEADCRRGRGLIAAHSLLLGDRLRSEGFKET